jgi:thioredoxin 1
MMMNIVLLVVAFLAVLSFSEAFFVSTSKSNTRTQKPSLKMAVVEVTSIAGLDQIVGAAGNKLVVVDYSTTWCGPCKLVLPKYMELSDRHANVIFLKCIGDASTEASALMKREGVRSVPTFHMWKAGSRVDVVNGARIEEVSDLILLEPSKKFKKQSVQYEFEITILLFLVIKQALLRNAVYKLSMIL